MGRFVDLREAHVQCPVCGDEYEQGHTLCASCAVPLLPPGVKAPPRTRHLGRFAGPVGRRVADLLDAKGIRHDVEEHDGAVVVRVDADWRDDVASQLYTGWPEFLHGLEREVVHQMLALGGTHPGWHDAPADAWTDRHGRLKVEVEDDDPDAGRALGPALLLVGIAMALLGLVDAIDAGIGISFGLGLAVLGALLPR